MNAVVIEPTAPFQDSRRLLGTNLYFDGIGAVLETAPGITLDVPALARWRAAVERARAALSWPQGAIRARPHANGTALALEAPLDQLLTATEVNEWALYVALGLRPDARPLDPDSGDFRPHVAHFDEAEALHRLHTFAQTQANPALLALLSAASARGTPCHIDDEQISIGEGGTAQQWPANALPDPVTVDWSRLAGIPKALVTGSNGKTTTVRLLAAMLDACHTANGYSCTDGLMIAGHRSGSGDYSGPVGARTVLRDARVQAAVLETARGGLLRRGLALQGARAAVLTNVSADHLGEYGIDSLDDIAEVKLLVARALADDGVLVVNADDPIVSRHALTLGRARSAWFALDLTTSLARADHACGVADGELRLVCDGHTHSLGSVASMPLTLGGAARYNIANIAAAALAAHAMGIAPAVIAGVLARFGADHRDNPGRLQHWQLAGVNVLMDYAHNPDGLAGLLQVASSLRHAGRLALLVGHAGNRRDADFEALALVAAQAAPTRVWLKDMGAEYLRGRAPGEVPAILQRALLERGMPLDALPICLDEIAAVTQMLEWATAGDVLVLPVHSQAHRQTVATLLDRLQRDGWHPGQPLPV